MTLFLAIVLLLVRNWSAQAHLLSEQRRMGSDDDVMGETKLELLSDEARILPEAYVVVFKQEDAVPCETKKAALVALIAAGEKENRAYPSQIRYEYTSVIQGFAVTHLSTELLHALLDNDYVASIVRVRTMFHVVEQGVQTVLSSSTRECECAFFCLFLPVDNLSSLVCFQ